jgi:hypothetical protein
MDIAYIPEVGEHEVAIVVNGEAPMDIPGSPSVPILRIQGNSIHRLGAITAAPRVAPSFMQCFFTENTANVIDSL